MFALRLGPNIKQPRPNGCERIRSVLDRIGAAGPYVEAHPELKNPLQALPKYKTFIGKGANFVIHVGSLMRAERGLPEPAAELAASH